jgi:hypothetical protein
MKYLLSLITVLTLFSCTENEEQIDIDPNNQIIGSWSYAEYSENNIATFKRVSGIVDDKYTCTLKNNGSFMEHKNAGWCGTPPITFDDYEGSWQQENNKISIQSEFWGGTQNLNWEVISLTDETLKIKIT